MTIFVQGEAQFQHIFIRQAKIKPTTSISKMTNHPNDAVSLVSGPFPCDVLDVFQGTIRQFLPQKEINPVKEKSVKKCVRERRCELCEEEKCENPQTTTFSSQCVVCPLSELK